MYELIFQERLLTVLATVFVAFLASSVVGARRLWLRGLMYNLSPAMGLAFYIICFFPQSHPNLVDLIAGVLFEATVLLVFYQMFLWLKKNILPIREEDSVRVLKWALVLQIIFMLPNILQADFGVFSAGSRIEYLYAGSLPKYFTYAGILVSAVQAVFLASLITVRGRLGALGWAVISLNFALSVVAGSKGAVFLWLLSVASLIDYRRAQISIYKIMLALLVGGGAVLLSSTIVANFLGLDLGEFFQLATSRFFLVNDARALAFDLRTSQSSDLSLLPEAFRSLGNLFGSGPRNEALGVVLYSEAFSVNDGSGANTSYMALATYYFPIGYVLLPSMLGILGLVLVAGVARISSLIVRGSVRRLIVNSLWLTCILSFSQDFLAFQVLIPLVVLTTFLTLIYRPKLYGTST